MGVRTEEDDPSGSGESQEQDHLEAQTSAQHREDGVEASQDPRRRGWPR